MKLLLSFIGFVLGFLVYPLLFTPMMMAWAPDAVFFKWVELHMEYLKLWGF
jgi:hypothetical protein